MSASLSVLWRRARSLRLHVPPRGCPVCGLDVWASTKANRSHRGRVFCCHEHKEYAGHPRPRPRPRVAAHVPPKLIPCPWPQKVRFDSEEEARTRFHTVLASDGQLEPYACPSTEPRASGRPGLHWHVGHPHVDDGQRVVAIARVNTGVRPRIICPTCTKNTSVTERGNIHSHRRGDGEGGRCPMSGQPVPRDLLILV